MPEASRLFMARLEIERSRLFEFARATGLPIAKVDMGYLVHAALRAAFGEHAPQPFTVQPGRNRTLTVLGYADKEHANLCAHAQQFADPLAYATCQVDSLTSKPMPDTWQQGARFEFEVRVCPIVRMATAGPKHRKGAEVDAFLARCWGAAEGTPIDRAEVYGDWLRRHMENTGSVRLLHARVSRFQRERLSRRDHEQERQWSFRDRPDVTCIGALEILDGAGFGNLLRRGIGRHRAFGFGMLLLRPLREP